MAFAIAAATAGLATAMNTPLTESMLIPRRSSAGTVEDLAQHISKLPPLWDWGQLGHEPTIVRDVVDQFGRHHRMTCSPHMTATEVLMREQAFLERINAMEKQIRIDHAAVCQKAERDVRKLQADSQHDQRPRRVVDIMLPDGRIVRSNLTARDIDVLDREPLLRYRFVDDRDLQLERSWDELARRRANSPWATQAEKPVYPPMPDSEMCAKLYGKSPSGRVIADVAALADQMFAQPARRLNEVCVPPLAEAMLEDVVDDGCEIDQILHPWFRISSDGTEGPLAELMLPAATYDEDC